MQPLCPQRFLLHGRTADAGVRRRLLFGIQGEDMKKCLLLLMAVLVFPLSAHAEDLLHALWPQGFPAFSAADRRHGVANDRAMPDRREPSFSLPPLPAAAVGTVRRVRLPAGEKAVALTFDVCELQCAVSGFDRDVVRALEDYGAHATFFAGGKWMRSHPERTMQLMASANFELGNHAWTHANFGIIDMKMAAEQVRWTQALYESLRAELGRRAEAAGCAGLMKAVPPGLAWFRLPYGRCSPESLRLLNRMGLRVIQWDVVADHHSSDNAAPNAARRVVRAVRPGSIILLHANLVPRNTAVLVRNLLSMLAGQGYRFVTVSELLSMGEPELADDGYFVRPGDNRSLDRSFGTYGTGENQ